MVSLFVFFCCCDGESIIVCRKYIIISFAPFSVAYRHFFFVFVFKIESALSKVYLYHIDRTVN